METLQCLDQILKVIDFWSETGLLGFESTLKRRNFIILGIQIGDRWFQAWI